MDEHDLGDLGSDFEFGPGTDLVLSMLALLVVLLAVVNMAGPLGKDGPVDNTVELRDEELAFFEHNSARLTPDGERMLRQKLAVLADAAVALDANMLRIKGYASPLPKPLRLAGGTLDGNVNLSAERAIEAAHALHLLGVPYDCLAIESYGRNRSPLLQSYLSRNQITIAQWDQKLSQGCNSSLSAQECAHLSAEIEKLYRQDRRVDLVVVQEVGAPCSAEQLRVSLKVVATGAP
jgi:outer membrane protein OmpA-like peptidoglycan-associated protein